MKVTRRAAVPATLLLTPLIDMIFLVLIFYMVNATMAINPALDVDLPEAYTSDNVLEEQILVTVDAGGRVAVGGTEVDDQQFALQVREEMARTGKDTMLLLGDESTPYRVLVQLMDRARIAGIRGVSLGTTPSAVPPQ